MEKIENEKKKISNIAQKGGNKVKSVTSGVLKLAVDSIGLAILKRSGNKDLAYKVIKNGRDIAETAGMVAGTAVKTGGAILDGVVSKVNSIDRDKLKRKAADLKNRVGERINTTIEETEESFKRSSEFENLQDKIARTLRDKLEAAGELKEKAEDVLEDLKEKISDNGKDLKEKGEDIKSDVDGNIDEMKDTLKSKMEEMEEKAVDVDYKDVDSESI